MRKINKTAEPIEFTNWKSGKTEWKQLKNKNVKEKLRRALLKDQHYNCCYCGRSIDDERMAPDNEHNEVVIEHIKPKGVTQYARFVFDYNNLLASCHGNKYQKNIVSGYTKEDWRTCDTSKDNLLIPVTPLDANCEGRTIYTDEGKIILNRRVDTDFSTTVERLGLNTKFLKDLRKAVFEGYFPEESDKLDKDYINAVITSMDILDPDGKLPSFSYQVKRYAQNLL